MRLYGRLRSPSVLLQKLLIYYIVDHRVEHMLKKKHVYLFLLRSHRIKTPHDELKRMRSEFLHMHRFTR